MTQSKPALTMDLIVSILLLLFCGFLIWATTLIRDPQFGELSPAAWPKAVVYVLTGFCVLYFLQSVLTRQSSVANSEADPQLVSETADPAHQGVVGWFRKYANPIICFALYFGFLITLPFFGTLIGGTLLVFLLLTVLGGFGPKDMALHAVIAVISVGAMWALFTFGLRVLLPRGELIPGI